MRVQQYIKEKNKRNLPSIIITAIIASVVIGVVYLLLYKPAIPNDFNQPIELKISAIGVEVKGFGSVAAREKILIASPENGIVKKLLVRPGQSVKKGDILSKISNYQIEQQYQNLKFDLANLESEVVIQQSELEIKLTQMRVELTQSENRKDKYELELTAYQKLVEEGIVSRIEYGRAKMNVSQALLDIQSNKTQLDIFTRSVEKQLAAHDQKLQATKQKLAYLEQRIKSLTITSDIDGMVSHMNLSVGQSISQGSLLFEVIEEGQLIAKVQVPQYGSSHISEGLASKIKTPNGILAGHIEYIDSVIRKGSVSVYVAFDDLPPDWLKLEQSIEAVISTKDEQVTTLVKKPKRFNEFEHWSFVVIDKNGNAQTLNVEYSILDEEYLQLKEYLNVRQKVYLIPTETHNNNKQHG